MQLFAVNKLRKAVWARPRPSNRDGSWMSCYTQYYMNSGVGPIHWVAPEFSVAATPRKPTCFHLVPCFSRFWSEISLRLMANPFTVRSSVFLEGEKLALGMQWRIMVQTPPFSFHQEHKDLVRCKGSLSTRCSTIKMTAQAPKRFITESRKSKEMLGSAILGINKHQKDGAVDFAVLGYQYWRLHGSVRYRICNNCTSFKLLLARIRRIQR